MTPEEQLADLRPTERQAVMDLVAQAGVNVSAWATRADGTPVRNVKANPAYCYEWTFGKPGEPIVLCVWHQSLEVRDGRIIYPGNLRELANRLTRWGNDRSYERDFRSRALEQARRATRFDFAVQRAVRDTQPVRLILLRGDVPTREELGDRAATVDFRHLDEREWRVESYDDEGGFTLVRSAAYVDLERDSDRPGLSIRDGEEASAEAPQHGDATEPDSAAVDDGDVVDASGERFIDQFTLLDTPERRAALANTFVRSPQVRAQVLRRARGHCELCGAPGFATEAGVYLETHHVIPLAEYGPDHPSNVVALCANDHRRAHHSVERDELRAALLKLLATADAAARAPII